MSTSQRSIELRKLIEDDNQIAINRLMSKFIEDKMMYQVSNINVDYESISSLDMELYSISSRKVSPDDIKRMKDEIKAREGLKDKIENVEDKELSGKDVKLVLAGKIILAPIKGKDIGSVAVGDKIKVHLDSNNPKAVSVAQALKYFNEEERIIHSIPARVVSKEHISDGGYKITCLIAKGIYVKIVEEEENIKIAVDSIDDINRNESVDDSPNKKIQMILIYVIAVLIIICLAIIFSIR
jgi:hypothetical protein